MGRQGKRYDSEFKMKLVMALLRGKESQEGLARRHQVSATVLSRWKEQAFSAMAERLKHNGQDPTVTAEIHRLKREVEERDQIIGELTVANQILKKTAWGA